jgi:hypothetical protein
MTRASPALYLTMVLLALCGCKRMAAGIASLAENTRTATERLVSDSNEAADQRERAAGYEGAALRATPLKLNERYETRQGPDGLFIYDTQEHVTARIGNQTQAGLNMDQAHAALDALNAQDAKHPETN